MVPVLSPSPPIASSNHDGVVSALNNTIETVKIVEQLVPLNLAKGVLATVGSILTIVKDTIQNKDDFAEVTSRCHDIGMVLWRATSGTPEQEISPVLTHAISELKVTVDKIQAVITGTAQRGLGVRLFSVSIDQTHIAAWKQDLDRCLQMFNTELNLAANMKLDQIVEMFEQSRLNANPNEIVPQRDSLPAKPPLFCGRNELVREVVEHLLQGKHIALLGPGGMGKSSVAKAVLHEDAILGKFQAHRYFVTYHDMDTSQISFNTFLDRIARALGVKTSGANLYHSVATYLTQNKVLLVLDNAETFLDIDQDLSRTADASRIMDAINDFGARPSVAIMLTTRSKAVPSNLLCTTLPVPPLEQNPAREAFTKVYHAAITPAILDKLLSALDFHPLSIILLAQAAENNGWSPDDLVQSWEREHTSLLDNGSAKVHSLSITIELSLKSPSIKKLGEDGQRFLQIIAFLPQGVDKKKLTVLFPTISNVHSFADTFCKQSLTYMKGDFIMMLAPIRLYISRNGLDPLAVPLLNGVKTYYYTELAKDSAVDPGDPAFKEGDWIISEDINVERLVALDLADPENAEYSCTVAMQFMLHLLYHKTRPTALHSVIMALPEKSLKRRKFWQRGCLRSFANTPILLGKAGCVLNLGVLAFAISQTTEALELYVIARGLYIRAKQSELEVLCLTQMADVYSLTGHLAVAEKLLAEATQKAKAAETKAFLDRSSAIAMACRGKPKARDLAAKVRKYYDSKSDKEGISGAMVLQAYVEIFSGNCTAARNLFEEQLSFDAAIGYDGSRANSLLGLAEVSLREGKLSEVYKYLDEARELALKTTDVRSAIEALYSKAALAANEGQFALARDLINQALTEATKSDEVACIYTSARNELLAQEYSKAKEIFLTAITCSDALGDIRMKARSARGLGEIALLEKDLPEAQARFSQAKSLCDDMGIPPELLYIDSHFIALNDTFEGGYCSRRDAFRLHDGWDVMSYRSTLWAGIAIL